MMSQVFNLRGLPIQTVAEIRTDLIKDHTGNFLIMSFDQATKGVTLHNVETIWTVDGREITANNIITS